MRRGLLTLFTLLLIGGGVYGGFYFSRLQKAEALINQSIVSIQDGKYEDARKLLTEVVAQYNYSVAVAPALYLLADSYVREEKYQNAIQTFKTLLSDSRIGLTDRWSIQSVSTLSKLYRRGLYPLSNQQVDILKDTLSRINERIRANQYDESTGFSELQKEIDSLEERILALSFRLHIKGVTPNELLQESKTELGFLYLSDREYDQAEEIFSGLNTPLGKLGLAKLSIEMGEEIRGIKLLEELMDYDRTGNIRAYYLKEATEYGEELFREKRFDEALKVFEIIGRQADSLPYADLALYYIAMYYHSTKHYDRSLTYVEKILNNDVSFKDQDALLLKGYIYYDKRDYVRALKAFTDFIKRYPHSEKIASAREWKAMCERSIKYLG